MIGNCIFVLNKETMNPVQVLQQRKIRPTAMRILVLQYLAKNNHAVGLKQMETDFWHADRSTLFRTLKTFEEHKLVHRVDDGTGINKYALCPEHCDCLPKDVHLHFHCRRCEQTTCLDRDLFPTISLPLNFRLEEANLVLKGICGNC